MTTSPEMALRLARLAPFATVSIAALAMSMPKAAGDELINNQTVTIPDITQGSSWDTGLLSIASTTGSTGALDIQAGGTVTSVGARIADGA